MIARGAHLRRQTDIPPPPTGVAGIENSSKVVDTTIVSPTGGLVVDSGAPSGSSVVPPPLASDARTLNSPTTPTSTSTASPTPTQVENTAASSKSISMSTVIGACVGAFIGAAAFILLAVYFYRRYSKSLKQKQYRRGAPRSAFNNARNSRADLERRRSKAQAWDKLDDGDGDDKWEGMNSGKSPVTREVKEMDTLSPSSLGVFQKSPSSISHSNYHTAEDSPTTAAFKMNQHPYANAQNAVPEAKDLLGREPHGVLGQIDSGPPLSWGDKSSFLSSTRLSGGAMSPSLSMAIPTPQAVKTEVHHWESAEVVHYSETAEIVNQRQSTNPFFNVVVESTPAPNSAGSNSSSYQSAHSRSSSNATVQQVDVVRSQDKGKERVVSIDPFRDPLPKPKFINHITTSSTSSADNERAIRQLVAAASLDDLAEDEIQRRLRVASMQPSVISYSGDSMYTDADPDPAEEAMMRSFPVPPSSSGHETMTTHTPAHK